MAAYVRIERDGIALRIAVDDGNGNSKLFGSLAAAFGEARAIDARDLLAFMDRHKVKTVNITRDEENELLISPDPGEETEITDIATRIWEAAIPRPSTPAAGIQPRPLR